MNTWCFAHRIVVAGRPPRRCMRRAPELENQLAQAAGTGHASATPPAASPGRLLQSSELYAIHPKGTADLRRWMTPVSLMQTTAPLQNSASYCGARKRPQSAAPTTDMVFRLRFLPAVRMEESHTGVRGCPCRRKRSSMPTTAGLSAENERARSQIPRHGSSGDAAMTSARPTPMYRTVPLSANARWRAVIEIAGSRSMVAGYGETLPLGLTRIGGAIRGHDQSEYCAAAGTCRELCGGATGVVPVGCDPMVE